MERAERSIRRLQEQGVADPRVDPAIPAMALGAMVARFAWCNALRLGAR